MSCLVFQTLMIPCVGPYAHFPHFPHPLVCPPPQQIIDPDKSIFGNRITTRETFKYGEGKTLRKIVPETRLEEAIIVDDSKEVSRRVLETR